MKKLAKVLAVAAIGVAAAGAANAQQATANFTVSANVLNACSVAASDLVFGDYVASAAKDSSSTVTVTCTNGTGYSVGITGGATGRFMSGPGGATLGYGMFSDPGRTVTFNVASASGNGLGQAYPVYGRIPAFQYVAAGAYTETVTVLVAY